MSTTARRRGTSFEVAVRDYFRAQGFPDCERLMPDGKHDRGDLTGVPLTVQCKNTGRIELSALGDAKKQAATAKKRWYMAVHKRRNYTIDEAYATMPLWMAVELLLGRIAHE